MPYSLQQAATASGINRSTVLRAIKSGKISAIKNEHGEWLVEPVELHRVYPPVAAPQAKQANGGVLPEHARSDAQGDSIAAVLAAELSGARELVRRLEEQAEVLRRDRDAQIEDMRRVHVDLQRDRDAWRQQAEASQRLLTPPPAPTPARTAWWQRLTRW